jgi:hypothetical protein
MNLPNSPINTVTQESSYDTLQYSASVRLLRTTTSWGIHASIFLLGIIAFPVVLVCFLAGGLLLLPILALLQGCKFIVSFFGFEFKFPKLWSNLFGKKKREVTAEGK